MKEPEEGFYYHYKHNPDESINNYSYQVVRVARHTEMSEGNEDMLVIYRPLYDSSYYQGGKYYGARPLEMFVGNVEKNGKIFPRFQKITDEKIIAALEKIIGVMYGA